MTATITIPNRPVFRPQEVCELAEVQPFVLRTWEAEFPDLGVAKTAGGPRLYRRADVQRVLRIKQLLFVDGLTLAGARRRLAEEGAGPAPEAGGIADADVAALLDGEVRQQLVEVRRGLQWILGMLAGPAGVREPSLFDEPATPARKASKPPRVAARSSSGAGRAPKGGAAVRGKTTRGKKR